MLLVACIATQMRMAVVIAPNTALLTILEYLEFDEQAWVPEGLRRAYNNIPSTELHAVVMSSIFSPVQGVAHDQVRHFSPLLVQQ